MIEALHYLHCLAQAIKPVPSNLSSVPSQSSLLKRDRSCTEQKEGLQISSPTWENEKTYLYADFQLFPVKISGWEGLGATISSGWGYKLTPLPDYCGSWGGGTSYKLKKALCLWPWLKLTHTKFSWMQDDMRFSQRMIRFSCCSLCSSVTWKLNLRVVQPGFMVR